MFCGMLLGRARAGRQGDLLAAAQDHAEALRLQPGCVGAYVLVERETGAHVSLSIFTSEDAFNRGMEATTPIIGKHHLENVWDGPSTLRLFDVR